jgi:hypothetical protein
MMNVGVSPDRQGLWTAALVMSLSLAALGAGTALAQAAGLDWSGIWQACQHTMASAGSTVSLDPLRVMTGTGAAHMGPMGMGR